MSDADHGSVSDNSLRVLLAQVTGNAGYFVSVLLLARGLGPASRGTVAFVTVAALVTASVSTLGSGEASKVLAARRPAQRARVLSNLLLLTLATSLAGAALVLTALILLPAARPAGVGRLELLLLGIGAVAAATNVAAVSFLQGCSRFREYTRIVAAAPWLYALLLAAAWRLGGVTVHRAVSAWVVAQAGPSVLLWRACARDIAFGRPDRALLRETLPFGLRAWAGNVARFLNARVDQVLMGLIASEATLGVYAVAVNASEVLFYVPTAVATALLPVVARAAPGAGPERTLRVFRAVALLTLAAVALAALLGPLLIPLVFGGAYGASVRPFLLLLPSAFGFAASAVFSNALLASSAPGLSSLGATVSLAVGIGGDIVLIPRSGASGAAAAASIALLCGGAAAALAYGLRARVSPAAFIPRPADLATLARPARRLSSRRIMRRAGAMRS